MNWKPIKDAPLDGTCVDLWVVCDNAHPYRLTDCRFQDGRWKRYSHALGEWRHLDADLMPTHYCLDEPPQEPLPWPTEDGFYWVAANGCIECREVLTLPNEQIVMYGRRFNKVEVCADGWQFIRATPPTFPAAEK